MSGIFPHNSNKCHCPECSKVRAQVRDLARLEFNAAEFDAELARKARFTTPKGRIAFPLADEKEFEEWAAGRCAVLRRVYFSREHDCHWQWRYYAGEGWRKTNVKTGQKFGPTFRRVEHTETGYRASRARSASPRIEHGASRRPWGKAAAIEHIETKQVGDLSQTVTDRVEFEGSPPAGKWSADIPYGGKLSSWVEQSFIGGGAKTGADAENPINLTKEDDAVLNPLKLSILFWRASHPGGRGYPFPSGLGAHHVDRTLRELEREQLITLGVLAGEYALTERARVFVSAVKALPLPIKPEPAWEMPS